MLSIARNRNKQSLGAAGDPQKLGLTCWPGFRASGMGRGIAIDCKSTGRQSDPNGSHLKSSSGQVPEAHLPNNQPIRCNDSRNGIKSGKDDRQCVGILLSSIERVGLLGRICLLLLQPHRAANA